MAVDNLVKLREVNSCSSILHSLDHPFIPSSLLYYLAHTSRFACSSSWSSE